MLTFRVDLFKNGIKPWIPIVNIAVKKSCYTKFLEITSISYRLQLLYIRLQLYNTKDRNSRQKSKRVTGNQRKQYKWN